MSPQEPPEVVKWALMIGVPTLMVVLTLHLRLNHLQNRDHRR